MHIVLVGIGGAGLSAIAYILTELGYDNIIGIDSSNSQITDALQKKGIKILDHGTYTIQKEDFVIYSDAAINSPEIQDSFRRMNQKHKKFHKPFSYFEFLGELSKYFKTISVTGTHGKSTTTALTAYTLSELSGKFGLGIVGSLIPDFQNYNFKLNHNLKNDISRIFNYILTGTKKENIEDIVKEYFFVVEADEFNKHFLILDTNYAIITNTELDHSDSFENEQEYFDSFRQFIRNTRFFGVGLQNDKDLQNFKHEFPQKLKLIRQKKFSFRKLIGEHNQKNASLSYQLIRNIHPSFSGKEIAEKIEGFNGLWRRTEFLGENKNGVSIYSDYGHHPSEIKAVHQSIVKNFPDKKILCIFQPHQARRIIEFFSRFTEIIKKFDENLIYDVYAARENIQELKKQLNTNGIGDIQSKDDIGKNLAEETNGNYIIDFSPIKEQIEKTPAGRIIIIFSAGDLDYLLRNYMKE